MLQRRLHRTWLTLAIAALAVTLSGSVVVRRFFKYVLVPCRGYLVQEDWQPDATDLWWRNTRFAAESGGSRVAVVEPADAR